MAELRCVFCSQPKGEPHSPRCGGEGEGLYVEFPDEIKAERDRYHEALQMMEHRVMTFGGFQRAERGEFWISRDDVLRLIAEALEGPAE